MALRAYVCSSTGWTWEQVGRLTIPRLRALRAEWRQRPPVHWLVASYLGHEPSAPDEPDDTTTTADDTPAPPPWLGGGRGVQASEALRAAQSTDEVIDAAERMFFGKVHTHHG